MQGYYLTDVGSYDSSWFSDPRFVAGAGLFFAGMAINIHSDGILRNLRKPGETGWPAVCPPPRCTMPAHWTTRLP